MTSQSVLYNDWVIVAMATATKHNTHSVTKHWSMTKLTVFFLILFRVCLFTLRILVHTQGKKPQKTSLRKKLCERRKKPVSRRSSHLHPPRMAITHGEINKYELYTVPSLHTHLMTLNFEKLPNFQS